MDTEEWIWTQFGFGGLAAFGAVLFVIGASQSDTDLVFSSGWMTAIGCVGFLGACTGASWHRHRQC